VCYRKASNLLPNDPDIGFSEATALLLHGDFGQAWPGYEWRWKIESRIKPKRVYPQPLWTGEKLRAGRPLIWGEQGIGDEIMFAGLVPDLVATGNLSLFATLFAESEVQWISLQYGSHAQAEVAHAPLFVDRTVDQLVDMDRFAAQVASMDLVITIDNSTAHLAGALGVPVWVLLPFAPDWRWQLDRSDSPWYPSMRLFRQPRPDDWHSVVQEIRSALLLENGRLCNITCSSLT
jgi:hypothetical protein